MRMHLPGKVAVLASWVEGEGIERSFVRRSMAWVGRGWLWLFLYAQRCILGFDNKVSILRHFHGLRLMKKVNYTKV